MTSAARFIVLWAAVTVPPMFANEWVAPYLLREVASRLYVGRGMPGIWFIFAASAMTFGAIAAFGQSRLLSAWGWHARRWVLATVAAQGLSLAVGYSIWSQGTILNAAGTRAWIYWVLMAGVAASHGLTMGVARALSLWGRRWPPVWILWLAGSIGLSMGLWLLSLVFNLVAGGTDGESWSYRVLQFAHHLGDAAGTAWLIHRLAGADRLIRSTNQPSP